MSEAVETAARVPRGGVGGTLFLVAFAAIAICVQALWVAFLVWLAIRIVF
jgi:hypothetical protein